MRQLRGRSGAVQDEQSAPAADDPKARSRVISGTPADITLDLTIDPHRRTSSSGTFGSRTVVAHQPCSSCTFALICRHPPGSSGARTAVRAPEPPPRLACLAAGSKGIVVQIVEQFFFENPCFRKMYYYFIFYIFILSQFLYFFEK